MGFRFRLRGPGAHAPGTRMEGPGAKHLGACGTMKYVLHSPGALPRTPGRGSRRPRDDIREADFS
ncbi:hypothetical protein GCM10015535_30960 [Streptomyces gelaticus]|uniref:Uncharacterized protein n=1 Tax=Streptomyces gelaticus TaxID=285446 RepID=A0ABQ2VZ80_9ACTN|nr:hypothetical protein GCM10015535_30960 [Streptomyces gelaticus]